MNKPNRADLGRRPHEVASMFDAVAHKYDLTNDILSAGQDRYWRKCVVQAVDARPGQVVLDLAAGTATSTEPFADAGVKVIASDFSQGMIAVGRRRRPDIAMVVGDATQLPFADESMDAVTMSFALRNVVDVEACLREVLRVTKPGGCFVVCEFSRPTNAVVRTMYSKMMMPALPAIARVFSSNPEAYEYLAESIQAWPAQNELAQTMSRCGWSQVRYRNLTGGIVALHRGWKSQVNATSGPTGGC